MRVDGGISFDTKHSAQSARDAEAAGYDGAWTAETSHDPFLASLLAAEHTERLQIGTGIAVAFARNPMTTAQTGHDLQTFSKGRFLLGLGSQIKPHIEKRFSMPWSQPAARMREYIAAMRAIWACWNDGEKLDFRGDFYTHTLMTPFFNPGPSGHGAPKVFLAGVGALMTEVAGEVCDGFICHGFTTERYLREVTLPALERGRAKAGKTLEGFEICGPSFVVTGTTEEELEKAKQGKWVEMGELVDDEILETFAVVGEPEQVAPELLKRYGDCVSRISFYTPYASDPARWGAVMRTLQEG